jgi:hypothetical protein
LEAQPAQDDNAVSLRIWSRDMCDDLLSKMISNAKKLAERVGFEALNAVPCTALHELVRTQETKHLSEFRLPPDFIDVF